MPGLKVRLLAAFGETVPGTDQLAVITAEDAVTHQRAQLQRNAAAVLDGEVGDAAAGIEDAGFGKGLGWTDVDAGRAAPAVGFGFRGIDRQRQVDEQFAQQKPGAGLAIKQQGVFADPAQPGVACQRAFQYWSAVGKGAKAYLHVFDLSIQPLSQLFQAFADQLVVIAAQSVAGHIGFFRVAQNAGNGRLGGQVIHSQHDDALGAGHQQRWVQPFVDVFVEVIHAALVALVEPGLQPLGLLTGIRQGDGAVGKTQCPCLLFERLRK